MKTNRHSSGFTMIELIAVLLLVGILASSIVISLLPMVQGLSQVQANTETAQKARLAMARVSREMMTITNIVSRSSRSITYQFLVPAGSSAYMVRQHTLQWSGQRGDAVLLEGVPLVDHVDDFQITPVAGSPESLNVMLAMDNGAGIDSYTMRMVPRNIPNGGSP